MTARRHELVLVPWPKMRALPLLRQPVMAAAPARMRTPGNHRSRVTMRGYHAGRKPGNWGNIYPAEQLRDCATRAGIEKRVHPHGLRHTFASELADEGVPINVISRLLGHSNSGTTARYIDHINPAAAIDVARARVWER